jgi:hypothetical protein
LIEPQRDRVQVRLREAREICPPREILSQQAIGILAAAALPRIAFAANRTTTGFFGTPIEMGIHDRLTRERLRDSEHAPTDAVRAFTSYGNLPSSEA